MKKKLNTRQITSDLSGSKYFERGKKKENDPTPPRKLKVKKRAGKTTKRTSKKHTEETSGRPDVQEDVLLEVVGFVLNSETDKTNTPIYFNTEEREMIDDYLLFELQRKHGLKKRDVTLAMLMRICTIYMLTAKEEELTEELTSPFKGKLRRSIKDIK